MSDFVNQVNDNGTIYDIHDKRLVKDGDTARLTGNLAVSGNLGVSGSVSTPVITADETEISAQKPIVEVMTGYSFEFPTDTRVTITYAGACKNGNKLTLVIAGTLLSDAAITNGAIYTGKFRIPSDIGAKLFPMLSSSVLDMKSTTLFLNDYTLTEISSVFYKRNNSLLEGLVGKLNLAANTTYAFRQEVTFLLSDSLAV